MRDFSGEQVNHNQRTKECVGLILSFRSSHAGGDAPLEEAAPDFCHQPSSSVFLQGSEQEDQVQILFGKVLMGHPLQVKAGA